MVERSYNGWVASADSAAFGGLDNRVVPGTDGVKLAPGVRRGDVAIVLFYVAEQLHARVEPGSMPGCWGFAYRKNANANNLSCHASGTAFDWNAPRHPNGKRGTWTPAQIAEVRKILAEVDGVVAWLEFSSGRIDGMHFEIRGTNAEVSAVARKIEARTTQPASTPDPLKPIEAPAAPAPVSLVGRAPTPLPVLRKGDTGGWVVLLQRCLGVDPDGVFGDGTQAAVVERQRVNVLATDGVVGSMTWVYGMLRPFGVLRLGAKGLGVEVLQNYLGMRPGAGLDGEFGADTDRGVREVQTWGGIDPDGSVFTATYGVLARV